MFAHKLMEALDGIQKDIDRAKTMGPAGLDAIKYYLGGLDLPMTIDEIRNAEKFEVPDFTEIERSDIDEVDGTVMLLAKEGLFTLPYPLCYIEMVVGPKKPGSFPIRVGVLCRQLEAGKSVDYVGFMCVGDPRHGKFRGWHSKPTFTRYMCTLNKICFNYNDLIDTMEGNESVRFHEYVVMWLVFLLSAKGTSQVKFAAPDKLNKARLKSRQEPIDEYRKVLVPGFVKRMKDISDLTKGTTLSHKSSDEIDAQERKRMRLHWRRAHIRNQAYGAGRKLHKPVMIAAQLIGYEEEGKIYHLQYGQELTPAVLTEE